MSGALVSLHAGGPALRAAGLGLVAPGAGFLIWAAPGSEAAYALAAGSLLLFLAALVAWFATGNVLLPPLAWAGTAAGAATGGFGLLDASRSATWTHAPHAVLLAVTAFVTIGAIVASRIDRRSGPALPAWSPPPSSRPDTPPELSLEDLQRLRLLLDRALQPVDAFDGFEWRDQFQTAAVRYQLNFTSYALSAVQAACLPAMQGWLLEAQRRLLAKQSDPRIWRYWRLENLWGNLRLGADPVTRDNIMYSGFVAAQVALAEQASGGRLAGDDPVLDLRAGCRAFAYRQDELVAGLADQYATAPYGLLACEPNWIYPLCNAITATALSAHDARHGTTHWARIAPQFRLSLAGEFTRADGRLVPFRSSLTGLAPPALGGAVMQAFPCYFLNALFPDLAAAHWARFREELAKRTWRRAFWPVDVGNYGFSRASSLAASAAAATEMGDRETSARLLGWLDESCPEVSSYGVRHRRRASLWAHALETIARHGGSGGLRRAATAAGNPAAGPFLEAANYPDVLVAAARTEGRSLRLVLWPGGPAGSHALGIGGLEPERPYRLQDRANDTWMADRDGRLQLTVMLAGRTELRLVPVA